MRTKVYYFPHLDGKDDYLVCTTSLKKCAALIGNVSVSFLRNNRAILTELSPSHELASSNPGTVYRRPNTCTRDVKPWASWRVGK